MQEKHIHFIGIGGVQMSGLAHMLHDKGIQITGSDMKDSLICQNLQKKGITVYVGHKKEQVAEGVDLVVINAAVPMDNPELLEAKRRNIPVMDRPVVIEKLIKNYKNSIAVAGTHGKTTVTSMLAHTFVLGGLDPSVLNGGFLPILDGYHRVGKSDNFIVEACEYKDSFLAFKPKVGIILNVEMDHPDYFLDIEAVYTSFEKFAHHISPQGFLILADEIKDKERIIKETKATIITFGRNEKADVYGKNIRFTKGYGAFELFDTHGFIGVVKLRVVGEHNIDNALATCATWLALGLDREKIVGLISSFTPVKRRFEKKGTMKELEIYDDFAHHPTEIKKTIQAASLMNNRPLTVLFQPHTSERTFALYDDFMHAFSGVDKLLLLDVYAPVGREEEINLDMKQFAKDLTNAGIHTTYIESFEKAEAYIKNTIHKGMLITMGAGNVYLVGERVLLSETK